MLRSKSGFWPAMALLAAALASGSSAAQTLEESYAKLCAGADKSSESCQVLRKALQEKLASEKAGAAQPEKTGKASATAAQQPAPASAAPWGFFAALPDSGTFHAPFGLYTFSWKDKNRVMERRNELTGHAETITLLDDGTFDFGGRKMTDAGNGTFLVIPTVKTAFSNWREFYSVVEGGVKIAVEHQKDGRWEPGEQIVMTRLTAQQLAETIQQARSPENIRANWGAYAQMAGRSWVNKFWESRTVYAYEWVVPGLSMSSSMVILEENKITAQYISSTASIVFNPVTKSLRIGGIDTKVASDGSFLVEAGTNQRTTTRMIGTDSYEEVTEWPKNGKWKRVLTKRYKAVGSADIEQVVAELSGSKSKGSGSGVLGSLAGAVGGAAAGAAFGGDTKAVLGGAAKGAAMFSSNAGAAAALDVSGDSLIGGNTANAPGGAAAVGGSGGASYPTRPNALGGSSACSMMNESNYRQVGVEGGNDTQLKTMCAQAYEYYTMYKRAIAQGYSEADANRTYDAHQKAAQNAMSFYANNRAN